MTLFVKKIPLVITFCSVTCVTDGTEALWLMGRYPPKKFSNSTWCPKSLITCPQSFNLGILGMNQFISGHSMWGPPRLAHEEMYSVGCLGWALHGFILAHVGKTCLWKSQNTFSISFRLIRKLRYKYAESSSEILLCQILLHIYSVQRG